MQQTCLSTKEVNLVYIDAHNFVGMRMRFSYLVQRVNKNVYVHSNLLLLLKYTHKSEKINYGWNADTTSVSVMQHLEQNHQVAR